MIEVAASRRGHPAAADDANRMLLVCVLHDALYLHLDAKAACPRCRALGGDPCADCWIPHQEPSTRYARLMEGLEDYRGIAEGTAYPLTTEDLELLANALPEAVTYRRGGGGPADRALLAAYRELAAGITR